MALQRGDGARLPCASARERVALARRATEAEPACYSEARLRRGGERKRNDGERKRKSTVPLVGSAARTVEELRAEAHKARWTCNANKQHERERAERACTKTVSIERHMRRVMHAQR